MTTFMQKKAEVERKWYVIDANDIALGRVATKAAHILRGKHKVTYTPHVDCGDYVIIVNASKVKLTGNKLNDKLRGYYNYYGFNTNLSWLIDIYTYTLLEITSLLISKYKYIPTNLNELVSNLPIIKPYISIYI